MPGKNYKIPRFEILQVIRFVYMFKADQVDDILEYLQAILAYLLQFNLK